MWVKIDDGFTDHPKIEALSDKAFRLHVAGLCFCGRTMSDGFIPSSRVNRLLPKVTQRMVAELTDAGVWLERPGGFDVKDFLAYNPSKKKVEADRDAAAERKRRWQEKQGKERVPNGDRTASGTMPRPDPSRPEGSRDGVSEEPSALEPAPAAEGGAGSPVTKIDEVTRVRNVEQARAVKASLRGEMSA